MREDAEQLHMSDPARTAPEESVPQHIHFGAGSFGLGMVVEICHGQAGMRTVVVSRNSNKEYHRLLRAKGNYCVLLDGDSNRRMNLSPSLRYYTDQDLEQIVEMMAGPSVILITTSVRKENLPSIAPILARAIVRRSQQTQATRLCVMACENLPENSSELRKHVELHLPSNQLQHLLQEVFFCNTLVDRVCGSISCPGGSVDVPIEVFHNWVVQFPASEVPALELLRSKNLIKAASTETEFKAYETQKYWCMNGIHLATAAYAYNYNKDLRHISQALAIPVLAQKIKALQIEIAAAFLIYVANMGLQETFPAEALRRYNVNVFERLRRARTDTIGRILKMEEASPRAILEVLDRIERLVTPQCKILAERRQLVHPKDETVVLHSVPSKSNERLELDDAVQQVIFAMRAFAHEYHAA